jgi:hypothetical protein
MKTTLHEDLMLDRAATLEEILVAISLESDPGLDSANQSAYNRVVASWTGQSSGALWSGLELYDELNTKLDHALN